MDTAKTKCGEALKAMEVKKFKDYEWHELMSISFKKMIGNWG